MTITSPNAYTSDDANWPHATFMFKLGTPFTSYKQIIENFSTDPSISGTLASPGMGADIVKIMNAIGDGDDDALPSFFSNRNARDTTLGGNDAINSLYQFCENDDRVHEFTYADNSRVSGEGRVYKECIEDNQQIMWLSFGIPLFNSLANFYSSLINKDLATLMSKGPAGSQFEHIGYMFGRLAIKAVMLPAVPAIFINRVLSRIIKTPVTKYYDFQSEMPLYYRFAQTMLVNLAVNMSLMDGSVRSPNDTEESKASTDSAQKLYETAEKESGSSAGVPDIFKTFRLDIFQIMLKRYYYETGDETIFNQTTDGALFAQAGSSTKATANDPNSDLKNADVVDKDLGTDVFTDGIFNAFSYAFSGTLYDCQLFVGFRIERGVDTSESLSHQIGAPEIKNTLNSKLQGGRQAAFSLANGNIADFGVVGDVLGDFFKSVKGVADGVTSLAGISSLTSYATGAGNVDIPDIWLDSSFSKNYSFTLQLRTPYGDPVSILQSLYVPLCLILAGALPRAVGNNSYCSPFVCRAYCKGFFASPLAIIDSVTIARGGDVHGWAISRLPTAIDLSFTLKDLSPMMFMAMGDGGGIWDIITGSNSSFNEYLMTLSGMGLRERILPFRNIRRKASILVNSVLSTKLNPFYWGMEAGSRMPARLLMSVIPTSSLPNN